MYINIRAVYADYHETKFSEKTAQRILSRVVQIFTVAPHVAPFLLIATFTTTAEEYVPLGEHGLWSPRV